MEYMEFEQGHTNYMKDILSKRQVVCFVYERLNAS